MALAYASGAKPGKNLVSPGIRTVRLPSPAQASAGGSPAFTFRLTNPMNADVESADHTLHQLSALADAGELAAALAHEVNDFLNVLHLQLTVLELKAPQDARGDLIELQRQAKQLAELIRHWQRSRSHTARFRPIDLGLLLHRLGLSTGAAAVRIDVQPN